MDSEAFISKVVVTSIFRSLQRLNTIKDPVVKYSMLIEIIHTILDSICNISVEGLEEKYDDTLQKVDDLDNKLSIINDEKEKNRITKELALSKRALEKYDSLKEILKKTSEILNEYLDGCARWIAQPIYSPDHPFGHAEMQKNKNHFDNLLKTEKP